MEAETFNETYYAALAQVIPVFTLVMFAAEHWRSDSIKATPARGLLNLACLGFAIVGEVVVLEVLAAREEPSWSQSLMMAGGFMAPIVRIAAPLAADAFNEWTADLPEVVRALILGGFAGILVPAVHVFGIWGPTPFYALIAVILFVMLVVSLGTMYFQKNRDELMQEVDQGRRDEK